MTPRKELFIKAKEALMKIEQLELVDYDRGQFDDGKKNYPDIWTGCLIAIRNIRYEMMSDGNSRLEGNATLEVTLYCKDGWMDQHNGTADPEHGLMEIDLIDYIVDALQFLLGISFKPLQLSDENIVDVGEKGLMAYRLTFGTHIYKKPKLENPYTLKKIQIAT